MHSVAMSPKAGAHGELCGLLAIRAALEARGDARQVILVPESAHGTNPPPRPSRAYRVGTSRRTTAAASISGAEGAAGARCGGVMITNPNTCGLFEPDMSAISEAVHAAGGLVYCDGPISTRSSAGCGPATSASMRCTSISTRPSRRRMAAAGPAPGPVVLSEALTPFAPLPFIEKRGDHYALVEEETAGEHHGQSFGRMTAFHGQMGMFTRAMAYILSHGADGLRQVSGDAVLNANYILRQLEDVLDAPFGGSGPCMHEALFSDKGFEGGLTTLDLAKGLIDEGYHPMTMYFPLVVHGAMLSSRPRPSPRQRSTSSSARCAPSRNAQRQATSR
jgi:glycine dehydrogenase subunit 2